jgi:hypothetical protein
MTTTDEYVPTVIEENYAIVKLYWSILRNNPDYKKDYVELEKDWEGKEMWFADKCSLLEPIDPNQDEVEPLYFFRNNQPYTHVKSKGFSKIPYARYTLTLELDIRRKKPDLEKEIKKIIAEEKKNALGMKRSKNLFGEQREVPDDDYYKDLLYVHKLMVKEKSVPEIKKIAEDEKKVFNDDTVKNHCKRLQELEDNLPVPIKK